MKSRCTEFPGPFPIMLLEAMAMLACPLCAFASMSKSSGESFLVFLEWSPSSSRLFHVGTRLKRNGSFATSCDCSLDMERSHTTHREMIMAITPSILPMLTTDTRPMNIIMVMTRNNRAAVEKFSGPMRQHVMSVGMNILLNVPGATPLSV